MNNSVATRGARPWWIAVVCGMASYIDAGTIVSWGIVLVIYQAVFGLTPAEIGLLSGLLTLGVAVGALLGGRLGDRFGGRSVFIVTMIVIVGGMAAMFFATDFVTFLIATAAVGLATGADLPVSLSTISEAASERSRGKMIAFSNFLWLIGAVVPGLLAGVVGDLGHLGAQIMIGDLGVVAILVLIGRLTIPESKSWINARAERAAGVETVRAGRARVSDLFRTPYLTPFLGLLVFYGLVNAGANALGQYSIYLLVNVAGLNVSSASLLGLVALPLGVIATVVVIWTIGTKARFLMFTISSIVVVFAYQIPAVFGFSAVTYLLALAVSTTFGPFGGETVMKFWSQRSFPTLLRTTAQGTVIAVGRFTAAAFAPLVPLLIAINARVLYLVLSALFLVGGAVAWFVFRTRDSRNEFIEETRPDETTADAEPMPVS